LAELSVQVLGAAAAEGAAAAGNPLPPKAAPTSGTSARTCTNRRFHKPIRSLL
jgi:hypothetical protein